MSCIHAASSRVDLDADVGPTGIRRGRRQRHDARRRDCGYRAAAMRPAPSSWRPERLDASSPAAAYRGGGTEVVQPSAVFEPQKPGIPRSGKCSSDSAPMPMRERTISALRLQPRHQHLGHRSRPSRAPPPIRWRLAFRTPSLLLRFRLISKTCQAPHARSRRPPAPARAETQPL